MPDTHDIFLEHSSTKVPFRIARDGQTGNLIYHESVAPYTANQQFQGEFGDESINANVTIPTSFEDWHHGGGTYEIDTKDLGPGGHYSYSQGIDASWVDRLYLSPELQTGGTTTQNPAKFVKSDLGLFAMTDRYVFEWGGSSWTSRLDVGASITTTDLIEYTNQNGTYLMLGTSSGSYYYSVDGVTWTSFPAGTAPAYRASDSANITSGTTLTVTKPTGTVDNDIMIATVVADNAATITPPAGWTQIASETSTDGRAKVFWRRASSEGSSYTFTISGTTSTDFQINGSGHDGWVTSSSADTSSTVITIGNLTGTKYQGILGFDTSSIPDAATVTAAVLDLYHTDTTIIGADIGYYDHGASITNADFSATPSDTVAGTMQQDGNGGHQIYNLSNLSNINKTGTTGFRINFASAGAFYTQIYGFDETNAANRPKLTVTYTVDVPATASISSYSGVITSGTPYDFVDSDYVADASQTTITSGTGTSTGSNRTVVVTFAATGDDTTVRSWTANSGTERVDTSASSYYPTISTYDYTTNSGSVATVTGTVDSAYDSLALGTMIALTPASAGSPQVAVNRWAIRGSSSGNPVLWGVGATGDLRNCTDPTNASNWSAASTLQLGEGNVTPAGLEVLDNVLYYVTSRGITSYDGTTVKTVWNNPGLDYTSTMARPYVWVDRLLYFTYSGALFSFEKDTEVINRVWPRARQIGNPELNGTITAITGDARNLYFAIKNAAGNFYIMKGDPQHSADIEGESFTPFHSWTYRSTGDVYAMLAVQAASDTMHSSNPQLVVGNDTSGDYFILPRYGMRLEDDSNYRFDTAVGTIYGPWVDGGAKTFTKYLNVGTVVCENVDSNKPIVQKYEIDNSGSAVTIQTVTSSGLTNTEITGTEVEYTRIRYILTMDTNVNTASPRLIAHIFQSSLNPPRKLQWEVAVEIADDQELGGGGDPRYGKRKLLSHLRAGLTKRIKFYDKNGEDWICRLLSYTSISPNDTTTVYALTLVELVNP